MPKTYKKDLTGKNFGRLTVLKWDEEKSINHPKHHFWICQCNCKDKTIVSMRQDHLLSNENISCGCYKHEQLIKAKKENNYEELEDYIIGYTSNTNVKFYIDKDDYDKIKKRCWLEDRKGYIYTRMDDKLIKLHRYIMGVTDRNIQVDHKDRNKKDNRKSNLRTCINAENECNRDTPKNNKSGFRGVFFNKDKDKWQVKVRNKFLGYFNSYDEAVNARLNAEKEEFGEFAPSLYEKSFR